MAIEDGHSADAVNVEGQWLEGRDPIIFHMSFDIFQLPIADSIWKCNTSLTGTIKPAKSIATEHHSESEPRAVATRYGALVAAETNRPARMVAVALRT